MTSQPTDTETDQTKNSSQTDQDMSFSEDMPLFVDVTTGNATTSAVSGEDAAVTAAAAAVEAAAAAAQAAEAAAEAAAAATAAARGASANQAGITRKTPAHAGGFYTVSPASALDAAADTATESAATPVTSTSAEESYGFELDPEELVPAAGPDDSDEQPGSAKSDAHATEPGVKRVRKKRRSHRKRKRIVRRIVIILIILLLIVAGVAIAFFALNAKGEQQLKDQTVAAVNYNEGATVEYNGQTYAYNTNMVSLCFMGYDLNATQDNGDTRAQADAIMVMALDTETGKLTVINIPRDSMVAVDEVTNGSLSATQTLQICLAFGVANDEESGAENVARSVQRVLNNMPITYYFAMNESAVAPLNDAIGGVTLTALQTIPNTNIVEDEEITLLGSNALKYVQWRDTKVFASSLARQERQMQYVKTFAHQALQKASSLGGISTLTDLFSTAQEYSNTNLGLSEFTYLATTVMSKGVTDINMITLEGTMVQGDYYNEYYLDSDKTYQTVLDVFYKSVSSDSENNQA